MSERERLTLKGGSSPVLLANLLCLAQEGGPSSHASLWHRGDLEDRGEQAVPSAEGRTTSLSFWSPDVLADFKFIIQIEET